jgi:hypothetical protein
VRENLCSAPKNAHQSIFAARSYSSSPANVGLQNCTHAMLQDFEVHLCPLHITTDHGTRPGSLTLNQSKTPELFTARDWLNTNKSGPGLRRGRCRASLWHAVTICLLFPARACRNGRLHIAFLQCCRRSRGAWACRDYGWGNPEHWARECRRRMIDLGCKSDNVRRCGGLLVERRDILLWPSVCAASWEFETWLMGLR